MPPYSLVHRSLRPQYGPRPALRQNAERISAHSSPTAETPAPLLLPSSRRSAPFPRQYKPALQSKAQTRPVAASYSCPSEFPPSAPPSSTQSIHAQNRLYGSHGFRAGSESGLQTHPPEDCPDAVSPSPSAFPSASDKSWTAPTPQRAPSAQEHPCRAPEPLKSHPALHN